MPKEHATEFEKIISAGRERKHNEALAAQIFNRNNGNRRASAPSAGPSLASRVGVKKRVSSGGRIPAGNINGDWTHDLHQPGAKASKQQQPKANSLAARIHSPGTTISQARPAATARANNRASKLANAFARTTSSPAAAQQQINVRGAPRQGMTIRGLAGPYTILAQNFAPGTTAADIESAVTPVGGLVSSCRVVKQSPFLVAEIVFENKEGADRVIETFHNQTADGRTLSVFYKPGGSYNPTAAVPTGPRSQEKRVTNGVLVDGSMGFGGDEQMDLDDGGRGQPPRGKNGLYSDTLVGGGQQNGGGGGGGRRGGRGGFRSGGRGR